MTASNLKLFFGGAWALKRLHVLSFALICAMVLLPSMAHASHHLQITPATCMPDESDAVSPPEYLFGTDGSASFAAGKTGIVTLRCNITNPVDTGGNPVWSDSEIYFQDDSTLASNHVWVYLHQIANSTGADTSELLLNSDSWDATSGWTFNSHILSSIVFDFVNNHYFVEIHLHRLSTTVNEKLLLVAF